MHDIHPTAVVDPAANLDADVKIGPLCHVGPSVTLGQGTQLISHVSILGPTEIGRENTIWPHATLGGAPQDLKYNGEPTRLIVGDHNDIREGVTMHRGTNHDDGTTRVGSHSLIMAYAHVAHDCVVGDRLVIGNSVNLGGHICIEDHVIIGGAAAVHPFLTIAQHAYIGGMTRLVHDVPPFMILEGNPATVRGVNLIGLARRGFASSDIDRLKLAYKKLFSRTMNGVAGQTAEAIAELTAQFPDDPHIKALVDSIRNANKGAHGRYRECLCR